MPKKGKKGKGGKSAPAKPASEPAKKPARSGGGKSMAKGKGKSKRRTGGGSLGMVELAGPAAAALFGPKVLLSVQKPKAGEEKDDKTALLLGGAAWWMSKGRYKKFAPIVLTLGAMAYRRQLVLAGEMNEDGKEAITAESAKEGE